MKQQLSPDNSAAIILNANVLPRNSSVATPVVEALPAVPGLSQTCHMCHSDTFEIYVPQYLFNITLHSTLPSRNYPESNRVNSIVVDGVCPEWFGDEFPFVFTAFNVIESTKRWIGCSVAH